MHEEFSFKELVYDKMSASQIFLVSLTSSRLQIHGTMYILGN